MEISLKILFLALFFAAAFVASSICILLVYRVKVAKSTEKGLLIKTGLRIIVHSGVLLACLQIIDQVLNRPSRLQFICDSMQGAEKFNNFFIENCTPSILTELSTELFSSGITAASWLIPFILAATGVNVLSHGLLLEKTHSEQSEDDWCKSKPSLLAHWFTWLSTKLT